MALTNCRECDAQVSTNAYSCPHCGAPRPAVHSWEGTGLDWKTQTAVFGIPLIHIAFGRNAQGRLRVAKGVIAIGQFAIGLITIAQFGIGILFGFGQFLAGAFIIAQVAVAGLVGIGQFAVGIVAIGQFVFGLYGLGQIGFAAHLWSAKRVDMEAVAFFNTIYDKVRMALSL